MTLRAVSLAYPHTWKTRDPAGGWIFTAQAVRQGAPYAQVSVLAELPQTNDAAVAANAALGYVRLAEDFDRTGQRSLEVPGAHDAYRIDYRYRASKGGGSDETGPVVRGTDVGVVDGQGDAYIIRITRRDRQLDSSAVKRIIGSIKLER